MKAKTWIACMFLFMTLIKSFFEFKSSFETKKKKSTSTLLLSNFDVDMALVSDLKIRLNCQYL